MAASRTDETTPMVEVSNMNVFCKSILQSVKVNTSAQGMAAAITPFLTTFNFVFGQGLFSWETQTIKIFSAVECGILGVTCGTMVANFNYDNNDRHWLKTLAHALSVGAVAAGQAWICVQVMNDQPFSKVENSFLIFAATPIISTALGAAMGAGGRALSSFGLFCTKPNNSVSSEPEATPQINSSFNV